MKEGRREPPAARVPDRHRAQGGAALARPAGVARTCAAAHLLAVLPCVHSINVGSRSAL